MEKNKINTILIIGNGFDLAHGLPTTYGDFLEFLAKIKLTKECRDCGQIKKSLDNWTTNSVTNPSPHPIIKKYILDSLNTRVYSKTNSKKKFNFKIRRFNQVNIRKEKNYCGYPCKKNLNPLIQKIYNGIENNLWFEHFSYKYKSNQMNGLNWIDFEQEIKDIIVSLDRLPKESSPDFSKLVNNSEFANLKENYTLKSKLKSLNTYRSLIERLQKDLDNLIKCLEIYLEDCVKKIPIRKVFSDIFNHDFDKVLSFNYTDTFARIYSRPNIFPEYDYIHGKTQLSSKDNNMVLGIDEYLEDTKKDRDTTWLQFKKYYQRIHKKTNCKYTKWLEDIDKNSEETELYIFGHSLAVTDKDVLRAFIMNDNIKTTVFYHDTETFGQQIANLVQIIGQDNLDKKVRSNHPSLIFKEQEKFCRATYDCYVLSNVHIFNDDCIKESIFRIHQELDNHKQPLNNVQDNYFKSQSICVYIYISLLENKIPLNEKRKEKLLEIARQNFTDTYIQILLEQEFSQYTNENHPDNQLIKQFIADISDSNMWKQSLARKNFETNIENTTSPQVLLDFLYNKSFIFNNNLVAIYKKLNDFFSTPEILPLDIWQCWEIIFKNNSINNLRNLIQKQQEQIAPSKYPADTIYLEQQRLNYLKNMLDSYEKTIPALHNLSHEE